MPNDAEQIDYLKELNKMIGCIAERLDKLEKKWNYQ